MDKFVLRDDQVLTNLECQKLNHFRGMTTGRKKDFNYYMAIIRDEELKKQEPTSFEYVVDVLNKLGTSFVFEAQVHNHIILINRFKNYMNENGIKYIGTYSEIIDFRGRKVEVSYQLFINEFKKVKVYSKLKNSKPDLSYRSREGNRPEDNLELFMLNLVADKKSLEDDDYKHEAALIFLRSRKDKRDFYAQFEEYKGNNIITSNTYSDIATDRFLRASKYVELDEADVINDNKCWNCPFKAVCENDALVVRKIREDAEEDDEKDDEEDDENQDENEKRKAINKNTPTDMQNKAISINEGVVRVNAGAGTGKTFVIVNRIIRLIKEGVDPSTLLLITFTNKGADEMRQRLFASELEEEIVEEIVIETFNSLGAKIVEENYRSFGFTKTPKLIDKSDKYSIIINILSKNPYIPGFNYLHPFMSFRYSKGVVVRLAEFFDMLKENEIMTLQEFRGMNLEDFLLRSEIEAILDFQNDPMNKPDFLGNVFYLYMQYVSIFKKENYMDFNDQIFLISKGIDEELDVLEKINFSHIIIDEYQDTNVSQLKIVKYFAEKDFCKSLMVVGDDSQSIFEFRGARPDIMINFHEYFDEVLDINITENFRSTKEIVDLANEINRMNTERVDKDLYSNKSGSTPEFLFGDVLDIADFDKLYQQSQEGKSVAIIARTNFELVDIKKELAKKGIPSIIEAPLVENPNVLLFNQILEFIINGDDDTGIFNYLFLYNDEFRSLERERQREFLEEYKFNLKRELPIGYTLFDFDGSAIDGNPFMLEYLDDLVVSMGDPELEVFYEELKEEHLRVEYIHQAISEMFLYDDRKSVQSFIDYKGITLSTAHSSKGREFDKVYVVIDRFKPAKNKEKQINEEIRLLFVAITRAKEDLFIVSKDKSSYFYRHFEKMADLGLIKMNANML